MNVAKELYQKAISFFDLAKQTIEKAKAAAASSNPEIIKEAQSDVGRWFRRKWLELISYRDRGLRLAVDKYIAKARKDIDEFMNILQRREAPIKDMFRSLIGFAFDLENILDNLINLAEMHNNEARLERAKAGKSTLPILYISLSDIRQLKLMRAEIEALSNLIKGGATV